MERRREHNRKTLSEAPGIELLHREPQLREPGLLGTGIVAGSETAGGPQAKAVGLMTFFEDMISYPDVTSQNARMYLARAVQYLEPVR